MLPLYFLACFPASGLSRLYRLDSTCRAEQDFIVRRLRDLGWEVLGADPNMSVTPADSTERKLLDQVCFLWPYLLSMAVLWLPSLYLPWLY